MDKLNEGSLVAYLRGRGLLEQGEAGEVRKLTGGYINVVFRLFRAAPGSDLIVKQSYEKSERTVLTADIARAAVETRVMRGLKEWIGEDCPTPTVIDEDAERHAVIMSAAPRDAVNYDDELQQGVVRPGVGKLIGAYLADLHNATEKRPELAADLSHNPGFALRETSIRSILARNPDLEDIVDRAFWLNRCAASVLVDSDLTPKNVLVHGSEITKLDFECAQWGHPALDVGVVLAHYMLHAVANPAQSGPLLAEAADCVERYTATRGGADEPEFVRWAANYTALMMLGRCDGDLILDLVRTRRRFVNSISRWLLIEPVSEWDDVLAQLHKYAALSLPG
ncbi:hypothetical protein PSU4_58050 [Pseudonocardia sulfidoxydans NBRC 16205]|uniref:Aminoglycoside phosphotransferase domain-containing protein n=1 Tax=Pseudonocardia sulfidoxydans NBRC 16205 TaxID=1223511 RepID=A0A511DPU8_9PSEU|nr:hypothetical protein PSU4_58050 [Pseudonocardia sulfidoxydans NBRC 16205]